MVWPGANNQLDYCTVPDIQKYYLDGSYNDLMVTVLGLVVYLLQVTKSLTAGILFREVNVQSKNDVQLIFKSESVHKQYHTQYVYQGSGGVGHTN